MSISFKNWLLSEAEYTEKDIVGKYIPREIIDRMLEIEEKAHLPHMQIFANWLSHFDKDKIKKKDLERALGCDGQLRFVMGDNWFILACEEGGQVEIYDFASGTTGKVAGKNKLDPVSANKAMNFLKSFGNATFSASARDDTSWPLIKKLADIGIIELLNHEMDDWEGTPMHDIEFKFK